MTGGGRGGGEQVGTQQRARGRTKVSSYLCSRVCKYVRVCVCALGYTSLRAFGEANSSFRKRKKKKKNDMFERKAPWFARACR